MNRALAVLHVYGRNLVSREVVFPTNRLFDKAMITDKDGGIIWVSASQNVCRIQCSVCMAFSTAFMCEDDLKLWRA